MSSKLAYSLLTSFISMGALAPLCAVSITLINDSIFPLTAKVLNATGALEGSVNLSPGQSYIWYDNNGSFKELANATTTPYTVQWVCNAARPYDYSLPPKKKGQHVPPKYQNEYGTWNNVPCTATVTAQGCTAGQKTCVIKKVQKKPNVNQPPSRIHKAPPRNGNPRPKPFANDGNGNFSNDGGQTWTNDGGDPFIDFDESEFTEDSSEKATSDVNVQ